MSPAMCARLLQRSSSKAIQRKREDIREQAGDEDLSEEQVTRILRAKMSWWDWFVYDYARYWYVIGALALDVFLGIGLVDAYSPADALGILLLIAVLVVLATTEVLGFFRLWPRMMRFEEGS